MTKILKIFFKLFFYSLMLVNITNAQGKSPADITITNDGIHLKGKFYAAEGTGPFTTVILLHGMPGNELDVLGLGKKLSESDINAFTFNYSGTHQSEGLCSFQNAQKDIKAAYDFIRQQTTVNEFKIDTSRILLGGYSFGGGMALTYAANHTEVEAVFSIAGNDHGEFIREYARNPEFAKMIDEMFEGLKAPNGPVRFDKGALPKEIAEIGIENIEPTLDLRRAAPMLASKEILLIAGWDDTGVTIDNIVLPLYRTLQKEKAEHVKIQAFQDDHAFKKVRPEIAETIIKWIKKEPIY